MNVINSHRILSCSEPLPYSAQRCIQAGRQKNGEELRRQKLPQHSPPCPKTETSVGERHTHPPETPGSRGTSLSKDGPSVRHGPAGQTSRHPGVTTGSEPWNSGTAFLACVQARATPRDAAASGCCWAPVAASTTYVQGQGQIRARIMATMPQDWACKAGEPATVD